MSLDAAAVYQRLTIALKTDKALHGVFAPQIRKALTADGLYDDSIAHNHADDGRTINRYPHVLFRKGSNHDLILVGIGDGASYLREKAMPVGKQLRIQKQDGGYVETTIQAGNMSQGVDHLSVGGFHRYETCSPIILAKSEPGSKMIGMLMNASGDELKQLMAKTLARSIRWQIARLSGVDVSSVPRIQVVVESSKERVLRLKDGVSAFAFRGRFAANVYYSGGRYGIGMGRYTSAGYGIVELLR